MGEEGSWGPDRVLGNPAFRQLVESELNSTPKGWDGIQEGPESRKPKRGGWRKSQCPLWLAVLSPHSALEQMWVSCFLTFTQGTA